MNEMIMKQMRHQSIEPSLLTENEQERMNLHNQHLHNQNGNLAPYNPLIEFEYNRKMKELQNAINEAAILKKENILRNQKIDNAVEYIIAKEKYERENRKC